MSRTSGGSGPTDASSSANGTSARSTSARVTRSSDSYQPRTVSLSCVPVYASRCSAWLATRWTFSGSGWKPHCRITMPGKPSESRRRRTAGVITPRSSAITGKDPSDAEAASNSAWPGPRFHEPDKRVARALRHRPVGHEPAEVVDAREVEELERPLQPLHPPAVPAAPPQRRPVVQGVAPQLALVGERVRRHAGDEAVLEELGVGAVVGRSGRDVDRHVADQPHPALGRIRRAAPTTRGRSAPGRPARRAPRMRSSPRSRPPRARGSPAPRPARPAPAGTRAAPATPRTRCEPCTATRSGRAARAAASATTTGPRRPASRRTRAPPGRGGRSAARWGGAGRPRSEGGSPRAG